MKTISEEHLFPKQISIRSNLYAFFSLGIQKLRGTSKDKSCFPATRASSHLLCPRGPCCCPSLAGSGLSSAWTACPLMFSRPADSSKPTADPACLEWFPALKIHKLLHHIPKNTNLCMYTDGLGDCPLRITLLHYYKVIYFSALCSVRLTPCNEPMERMVRRERKAEHRISNTLSCYLDCHGWAEAFLRGMQS